MSLLTFLHAQHFRKDELAGREGFEPSTYRLTAECAAIAPPSNNSRHTIQTNYKPFLESLNCCSCLFYLALAFSGEKVGWGSRTRTYEYRDQNPGPYRLGDAPMFKNLATGLAPVGARACMAVHLPYKSSLSLNSIFFSTLLFHTKRF